MKVICNMCKTPFDKQPKEIKKSQHNFCSNSCSAKFNNPLRKIKSVCPECKERKDYKSKLCRKCTNVKEFNRVQSSKIFDYIQSGNARIKFSSIRSWAIKAADKYELPKKCSYCSFDIYTEVCHIKPISTFSETSLMGEVNSKDNLIRLCPNHHIMFDRNLLTLDEVKNGRTQS